MSIDEPTKAPQRPGEIVDDTLIYDEKSGKYYYGSHPDVEAPAPGRAARRKSRRRKRAR